MDSRQLGSLDVSVIGLGCNNFGRRLDQAATKNVLDAAIAAGVTFLDTADSYGGTDSEVFMGHALKGRRDEVVLATKFGSDLGEGRPSGGARPEYVRQALEASLTRLKVDHVDLYQLHWPDPAVPIADTLGALGEAVEAGLVREIGCSNFSAAQLDEAQRAVAEGAPRFVSVQNEYSLLRRGAEAEVLPACQRLGVAFLPYFPLLSGILTGKYRLGAPLPEGTRVRGNERLEALLTDDTLRLLDELAGFAEQSGYELLDLAFAWLLAEPSVASVIAGAMSPAQLQRNAAASRWSMSSQEHSQVNALLDEHGFTAETKPD